MTQHGIDCRKAKHRGDGYLHSEDDDRPYEVDGVAYCGKCHYAMTETGQHVKFWWRDKYERWEREQAKSWLEEER